MVKYCKCLKENVRVRERPRNIIQNNNVLLYILDQFIVRIKKDVSERTEFPCRAGMGIYGMARENKDMLVRWLCFESKAKTVSLYRTIYVYPYHLFL